jgi:zeta-carotene desaturase
MLWNPLALAALNQPSSQAAAPLFARVLAEMFGSSPSSSAIVLPTKPLHLMYAEPAREYIERRGGRVQTGSPATIVVERGSARSVETGSERWNISAVISAVPWFAIGGTVRGETSALRPMLDRAAAMDPSPILTVNLWLDRQVLGDPFVGLPGRTMQWVFDKRALFGSDAAHLSLVSSGALPLVARSDAQLVGTAVGELMEAVPEARSAKLLRATVIREPRATFSLALGQPTRPSTETPVSHLYLAGDWIDTGLPGTIESAVRSGHSAAGAAMRQ